MTDKTIKMYKIVNNIIIECAPDNSDKSRNKQQSLPSIVYSLLIQGT